jgi:RNase P subunit RPR2
LYKQLNYNENIDSLNLAIKILNLTKGLYDKIYNKLIGENFYNNNLKFPKLTIKKLKKYLTLIENKNETNLNQNKIKDKNVISKINNIKLNNLIKKTYVNNCKFSDEKSTSSDSTSSNNEINKNNRSLISIIFFNNLNHSRFNFVKENNVNNENRIDIPSYVLNYINNALIKQINDKLNYFSYDNYKYINYFVNWKNFIEEIKSIN